jgi:quercetin dioxygenase-like cupin family protein
MKRGLLMLIGLSGVVAGAGFLYGDKVDAADPDPATIRFVSSFPISRPPAQYDLVHQVLDFAPGAGTREHRHSGPGFVTVLEGLSYRKEGNVVTAFGPRETYSEPEGALHSVRATGRTRVFASFLLSPGATQTLNDPNFAAPEVLQTTPMLSRTTLGTQPSEFNLTQLVVDLGPGAVLPWHRHEGAGIATVLEGEAVFRTSSGEVRRTANGMFLDVTSRHEIRNPGAAKATVLITVLVPKDTTVTTYLPD